MAGVAPASLKAAAHKQLVMAAATARNFSVTYGGVAPLELAIKHGMWLKGQVISTDGTMDGVDFETRLLKVHITKLRNDETRS